jgi:MFS family permease
VAPPGSFRRRNIVFLLLDTGMFFLAFSLVDLSSVLPSLLDHLTRQPALIGVLASLQTGCWLLPQLLVARVVASRRRKLPLVLFATTASRLSWLILFAALSLPDVFGPGGTIVAAYVTVALFATLDGVSVLAWYDVLARVVPSTLRGRALGLMSLSGVLAVVGGFVVQRVIGNPALPYPLDYRALVGAALLLMVIGVVPLYLVTESVGDVAPPPEPLTAYLRRLPGLLRDRPTFRRLVTVQLLVGMAGLAIPFYAPFGVLGLGLPEATVGSFVVGTTLGSTLGGFVWGFLGDHGRKELAIRSVALFGLIAPLIPLGLWVLAPTMPATMVTWLLALAMFCVGCANRSSWVAYANFVMEIAEPAERPVLIGLMNTLSGTLAVTPPLGGLVAGWLGYEAVFALAMVPALVGVTLSLGLRPASPAVAAPVSAPVP